MSEKTVVVALGHKALGTTLPEQKLATFTEDLVAISVPLRVSVTLDAATFNLCAF